MTASVDACADGARRGNPGPGGWGVVLRADIALHVDSKYVIQGVIDWLPVWKRRSWLNASKQPVQKVDLWQRLDALNVGHHVTWRWVKGHSGDPGNEPADALANRGIDDFAAHGAMGDDEEPMQ